MPDSVLALRAHTKDLFARLVQWHATQSPAKPLPAPLDSLSAPQFGSVTGISPLTVAKREKIVKQMYLFGLLAAAVAVVAGLPFHLLQTIVQLQDLRGPQHFSVGSGWYVVGVTVGVIFIQYAPYFRYKEVPVLQAELGKPAAQNALRGEVEKQSQREPETVKT
jgi:hypothetical protein